ncbi:MAG: hypothetical protein IT195_08060 [Microthrixaceae bacterium]|nr:hypothetical protein [Microthrixaceae bacterium]
MTITDYLSLLRRSKAAPAVPGTGEPPRSGPGATLTPATVPVLRFTIDGAVEAVTGGRFLLRVAGWVTEWDQSGPVTLRVTSRDDFGRTTSDEIQASVQVPGSDGSRRSFDASLPSLGGRYTVCVQALNTPGTGGWDTPLGCSDIEVDSGAPKDPLPESAGWLETINHYREGSGLDPMTAEAAWTDPVVKHLVYLRDTPAEFFTGEYANLHRENPASPYYTPEGAGYSHNVLTWAGTERMAMEGWIAAPFHALGGLDPTSNRGAFAILLPPATRMNAAAKFGSSAPVPPVPTEPIMTPGDGAVTALRAFRGESPDPRDPCPDRSTWHGLPIIVQLPYAPPGGITAGLVLPNGVAVADEDICVVTENNYVPIDPIYGAAGKAILNSADAVLVIPRDPLTPGTHQVSVEVPGHPPINWSFAVAKT